MSMDTVSASRPVVLLGASNLTLGWRSLLTVLHRRAGPHLDVFGAFGMGRSYVDWSCFGVRRLPGIQKSGIWDALGQYHPEPKQAPLVLITDIGNDLVYGRTPEQILAAVDSCIERLLAWSPQCRILVTGLPVDSVIRLSPLRFKIARTLLFPGARLQLDDIQRETLKLNEAVAAATSRRGLLSASPSAHWYGLDPIHVLRGYREEAFEHYVHVMLDSVAKPAIVDESSRRTAAAMRQFPPLPAVQIQQRWGRLISTSQPCYWDPQLRVFGF